MNNPNSTQSGKLFIVATPIGNLEDITIRAIKTLFSVDAILCEDTRHTGQLLALLVDRYGEQFDLSREIRPELIQFYDEIEFKKVPEIVSLLQAGKRIALVSDAGTPLVSDPGYKLVYECNKRNISVESIPGASAVIAALTISGLPTDKFFFLGYTPEKQMARMKLFDRMNKINAIESCTYVLYCAPHKLTQTLTDAQQALGDINIVIARELTKIHEQIWRGPISEALKKFEDTKGELVLLINYT